MGTYRFKTSLKCGGCILTITPGIERIDSIEKWSVDLKNQDKVLEIEASEDISESVIDCIKKAGFEISRL